jgi:hypothetical protein
VTVGRQKAKIRRPRRSPKDASAEDASADQVQASARPPAVQNPTPGAPLRTAAVPALQATIGNRAVTMAVQRQPGPGGRQFTKATRPKKGADVRAALRSELPGLLAGLTEEQINRWQAVVDYYAITRHIDRELHELKAGYQSRYPGLNLGKHGQFEGFGPYNDAVRALESAKPKKPPGGDKLTVDPRLLLADDVRAEPQWDVKAENAFRQWALAELAKDPPVFDMYPVYDDEIISRRTTVGSYTTKGLIRLADIEHQFAAQYAAMVTNRPEWQQLRTAYRETIAAYYDATQTHRERSKINKDNAGIFGIDIVRNIIEVLGEGDEDYPSIEQWKQPKALIDRAGPLLDAHQFEMAVPVLAMAELATAQAAEKIFAYDHRVETGAGTAVKWLGRVKTVGSIAAGIAAGPLGITGSALVAGGYTFVQEGAQNVSGMAHGQRTDLGLAGLVKQAGIATVMGLLGGALQTRFQSAMSARLAQVTGSSGGAVRDIATSSAAAMTSSVYTTAAETVLASVIDGRALPKSATEFADLIVDKALEAGAMDVALRGPSARAAREYQTWRSGRAQPVAPTGSKSVDPGSIDPNAAGKAGLPDPRQMPEDVAGRLLRDSGGWERLSADLHAGTGLGHGLMPAERRALLDRFEASRDLLARDVAAMFQGTVSVTDGGTGRVLEVRFAGDAADAHLTQAREYLDTKRPGWATDTRIALQAGPKALAADPKSVNAIRALEVATPEARRVADQLAPLYANWTGLSPQARLHVIAGVLTRQLRAAGVPDVFPVLGPPAAGEHGRMSPATWELRIHPSLLTGHTQTPEQFAYACGIVMHEGYHALQMFRAARTNPAMAQSRVSPDVYRAALDANSGARPAERLTPGSLEYAEAAAVRESLWNSGQRTWRETYARLDRAEAAMAQAVANAQSVRREARGSPLRDVAARDLWAAIAERDRAHDAYMRLPEEVGAWRTGKETEAAIKERLRLDRLIERARGSVQQVASRVRTAEKPYISAILDPNKPPSRALVVAVQLARAEQQRAEKLLNDLVARRHALATTGRPPGGNPP